MKNLLDESIEAWQKEAYNDSLTISDAVLLADYHHTLIRVIEERIEEEFTRSSPNPNPEPNPEMYGYLRGLLKVKEMLK